LGEKILNSLETHHIFQERGAGEILLSAVANTSEIHEYNPAASLSTAAGSFHPIGQLFDQLPEIHQHKKN
jgi:hypothetical protein